MQNKKNAKMYMCTYIISYNKIIQRFYIMYIMKIKNLSEIKYIFNVYVNLGAIFSTWRQQNFQSFKKISSQFYY